MFCCTVCILCLRRNNEVQRSLKLFYILNDAAVALRRKFLVSLLSRLATTEKNKSEPYFGKREDLRGRDWGECMRI